MKQDGKWVICTPPRHIYRAGLNVVSVTLNEGSKEKLVWTDLMVTVRHSTSPASGDEG